MTKFLLIVLLIAVIAVIAVLAWLAARSRRHTDDALPADDHPDAIGPGASTTTAMVPPPSDITVPSNLSSPLPPEPQPVEQPIPAPEPEVVAETEPAVEPEPVVEPVPPVEPQPVIEPEPEPVEPEPVVEPKDEPVIEPEAEPVTTTHGDPLAEEAKTEVPAGALDANAGWESDDDRTIHADPESGLYHTPDSPGYKLGPDGQIFESEDAAREAGFTRWDEPR
jgi:outer membrane biosynthesis protein TonB